MNLRNCWLRQHNAGHRLHRLHRSFCPAAYLLGVHEQVQYEARTNLCNLCNLWLHLDERSESIVFTEAKHLRICGFILKYSITHIRYFYIPQNEFMARIALLIFLMSFSIVRAQSIEELDNKGGFKEFKVGDSLNVHKDKIKFTKTLDNADTKLYLVKERVSVKSYTGEIELEFYKETIQEVIVSFKNSSPADFADLLKSLETLYGPSEKSKAKSGELARFEKLFTWSGKKINLRMGYDENYKLTEMVFSGHAHDLEKLKSDF
jgi:hypothetical protein